MRKRNNPPNRFRLPLQWALVWAQGLLACVAGSAERGEPLAQAANHILEQRCMVCHGCYDAPCQLKLEAHEGLLRGATSELVYDGTRLRRADLSRLFDDALTERRWRKKGFYPVIDRQDPRQGVMYRMLELKQAHPLPTQGSLPEGFDFSLYREQQCPKQEGFDSFARDYPLWGMPYGLPGLNTGEHSTMVRWLESGAPAPVPAQLSDVEQPAVTQWEAFLNGNSPKEQLMARYVYEHLFLASLYLESSDSPAWFRLVRSRTPPGQPLALIATRRPYDDPGVARAYYRLQRMPRTPLAKTHLPYRFDQSRLEWYRELFLETEYSVRDLPGYEIDIAANPFKSFQAMPAAIRYRFLLEEAEFTIMNFIKGPVCRGQIALNVIEDHFWVMFTEPGVKNEPEHNNEFLARESSNLRLPVAKTGSLVDLFAWRRYASGQQRYQQAKADYILKNLEQGDRLLDLDVIWDGDGNNPNAALTIFRHFDTASVVKGFVGAVPKTAWVIDYPLLERIHYLLVAGFDVYGAASHQLESRLYMDFLRMESEFNFLLFLPPGEREKQRAYWYRGARKSTAKYFADRSGLIQRPSDIHYSTSDPKLEFLMMQQARIYGAEAANFSYRSDGNKTLVATFEQLERQAGAHNSYLPQVSFVNVIGNEKDEVYTLLRNSGYSNIAQLFMEEERRIPEEDRLTIVRGFIGAYPNYFFQVNESELQRFAGQIQSLASEKDYQRLLEEHGVHRNAPWFWRISDKLHRKQQAADPLSAGLFDYNRYHSH